MDSFMAMSASGWSQPLGGASSKSSRHSLGHFRSLSSIATTSSHRPRAPSAISTHVLTKSSSSAHLANVTYASQSDFDDEMSTLPDPRSRAMTPAHDSSPSPSRHPDLNDEVATLSTKLINAINHQTILDDSLSTARHELDAARERIRSLEAQNASQRDMLAGDVWIRKQTVEAEKKVLQAKILEERQKRLDTDRDKKKIEQELENLTAALFEEANRMVIGAKEEAKADHEILQRKNDQLKAQLADSESLLKSQQEQLFELKHVMEHMMAAEKEDQLNITAPSSPGLGKTDSRDDARPSTDEPAPWGTSVEPAPPTSFPQLIQPVLRTDLSSYDDFTNLARLSRNRASSRVSSGSISALNALTSLGLGGSTSSAHPSNASTTSLNTSAPTSGSAPQSPNTPASTISAHSNASAAPLPSLKDTRFYKRVLAEDIEPTLRLDIAPGLSWLARRTVVNSMMEGSLVVEPVPASSTSFLLSMTKPQFYPCSLCGESRSDPIYLRNHRFRTSEADSAQRHPLCKYCLTRVRSTCDFLGFLRMVKDGHWRADDEDHERAAWEESVRLRDQMFWARIGGGVVPAIQSALTVDLEKSPRNSHEERAASESVSMDKIVAVVREASPVDLDRIRDVPKKGPIEAPRTPPNQTEGARSVRDSVRSLEVKSAAVPEEIKRLSLTIPSKEF